MRFARFILVSAIAAGANFGSRMLFSLAVGYPVAITLAFVVGLTTAFILNRQFVFPDSTSSTVRQAMWFTAVNLFALVQTLAISLLLARWLLPVVGWTWHVEDVAHAVGIVAPVVTSYAGHARFTFSSRERRGSGR